MKAKMRSAILRTLFAPPNVRHCSQTIYEALLGCCRMWQATGESIWRRRAKYAVNLLTKIQRPDGGFDIGYQFNFGLLHEKGDSTSPELVGLLALSEASRLFNDDEAAVHATRAAEWIRRFAKAQPDGTVAIPYSPYTTERTMVYNGTSFACGALGVYLGKFQSCDQELTEIYAGMVRYLDSVMTTDGGIPGRFWYYNDQSRADLDPLNRGKIDYYHQMQQVEVHALAELVAPVDLQARMILDAADHVVALHSQGGGLVPYTNSRHLFKGLIHVWGLSSVAAGLVAASSVHPERASTYQSVALETVDWIIAHAWNGSFFAPTLSPQGVPASPVRYMVRSDAWVFSSLASTICAYSDFRHLQIAEACYKKMELADFSGPESHASSIRLRLLSRAVGSLRRSG